LGIELTLEKRKKMVKSGKRGVKVKRVFLQQRALAAPGVFPGGPGGPKSRGGVLQRGPGF